MDDEKCKNFHSLMMKRWLDIHNLNNKIFKLCNARRYFEMREYKRIPQNNANVALTQTIKNAYVHGLNFSSEEEADLDRRALCLISQLELTVSTHSQFLGCDLLIAYIINWYLFIFFFKHHR